ncbi:MAG: hypothetical protein KJ077_19900 [Anaerolineae bacterium]|nr:hypothetical protein [Anaerolineae bacterium]
MPTTIEVVPQKIAKSVKPDVYDEEALTIRNVGDKIYAYMVECQTNCQTYQAWHFDPSPDLFAINAHEIREVKLKLTPPRNAKIGVHRFSLVVANDENPDDRVEVNLALKVSIPASWWITLGIVIVVLLLIVLYWQSRAYIG